MKPTGEVNSDCSHSIDTDAYFIKIKPDSTTINDYWEIYECMICHGLHRVRITNALL